MRYYHWSRIISVQSKDEFLFYIHVAVCFFMADWYAYDLKAKKKVKILNPRIVKMGVRYAVTGESEDTGIPVYHFVGGKKPTL